MQYKTTGKHQQGKRAINRRYNRDCRITLIKRLQSIFFSFYILLNRLKKKCFLSECSQNAKAKGGR